MDYYVDDSWYDGSGASGRKKLRTMTPGSSGGGFSSGRSSDIGSLMSRPGFTQFAQRKSLLDSAPGFDFSSSSMQAGLDYGFNSNTGLMSSDAGFSSNDGLMSSSIGFDANDGLMSSNVDYGSYGLMSNDDGLTTRSGLMSSDFMGNSGYKISSSMPVRQGRISQMGTSVGLGGSRKRPMPSQNQSELNMVAAEVQKRTRKKVDVNKILKVMDIVDKMEEMDGQQGRAGSGQSRRRADRLDQWGEETRYSGLDMMSNPELDMMQQEARYGKVRPDFTSPVDDPAFGMDPVMSRRLTSKPMGLSRSLTRNPNDVGRSQRSLERRSVDLGGRPDPSRRPRSTGRDINLAPRGGRSMDMSDWDMDMGSGQDLGGRQRVPGGRRMEISRPMDIGGRQMGRDGRQVVPGGRLMDLSDRQMDMRLQQMDRGGRQMDMRGRQMDRGGRQMDMRERPMDMGGRQMDMRERPMDMGGRQMDMRGRQMDMGGRPRDVRAAPRSEERLPSSRGRPNEGREIPWGSGAPHARVDRDSRPQQRPLPVQGDQSRTFLANVRPPRPVPARKLSMVEKVRAFIAFLKTEKLHKNKVNLLDCAFDRCKLGVKKNLTTEIFAKIGKRTMVTYCLSLDYVFLARSYGTTKKDVKAECYEMAVEALLNKSPEALLKQRDPGTDKVSKEMQKKYEEEQAKLEEEGTEESGTESKKEEAMEEDTIDKSIKLKTCQEKLKLLITHLIKIKPTRKTVVDSFLSALQESKCKLNQSYEDKELTYKKMPWFVGSLKLQDTIIAASSGITRESAKKSTYEQAVKFLKKKSLFVIFEGVTFDQTKLMPLVTVVTEQVDKPGPTSEKNIQQFLNAVAKNKGKETFPMFKEQAKASGLTVIVLTHKGSIKGRAIVSCDLFLDNIYMASGEGRNKLFAEGQLFQELLTVCSNTTAEVIYNDFNRLSEDDTDELIDASEMSHNVQTKTEYNNNFGRIKAYMTLLQGTVETDEVLAMYAGKDRDDFVIMEENAWTTKRYDKAYEILQLSAKMNMMALHFEFVLKRVNVRCRLFLQYDLVAESLAPNKAVARQRACAAFLFQQYQTQPTIRIMESNVGKGAISFETMQAKAKELMKESGATEDDEVEVTYKEINRHDKQTPEAMEIDEDGNDNKWITITAKISKWVLKATESIIKEFATKVTVDDLVFGPGQPGVFFEQVRVLASENDLVSVVTMVKELKYVTISMRHQASNILDIVKKNHGKSGKFVFLTKGSLPRPSDLAVCEAAAEKHFSRPSGKKFPK